MTAATILWAAVLALLVPALRSRSLLGPVRSGTRLLVEQPRRLPAPDRLLGRVAAVLVPLAALLALAVVPVGFAGEAWVSTSADLVWFNAAEVLLWVAWWCAGWSPNSVPPLVGAYRFLAQGLSYELPLMISLITVGVAAGSLRVADVQAAQQQVWFVVLMPVAAVVFVGAAAAFASWGPFASPMGRDLGGGVLGETNGPARLALGAGRALFLGVAAAMAATLFLGGPAGPVAAGWWWLMLKTFLVALVMVAVAGRLPVLPPDRTVDVGWVVVLPLTILQALLVSVLLLLGVL